MFCTCGHSGYTHADIHENNNIPWDDKEVKEGFITDSGEFVNRNEAGKIAYKCRQIDKECGFLQSYMIKF